MSIVLSHLVVYGVIIKFTTSDDIFLVFVVAFEILIPLFIWLTLTCLQYLFKSITYLSLYLNAHWYELRYFFSC